MFTIILCLYLLIGSVFAVLLGAELAFNGGYTFAMLAQITEISNEFNCDHDTAEKLYVTIMMVSIYVLWPFVLTFAILSNIAAKRSKK